MTFLWDFVVVGTHFDDTFGKHFWWHFDDDFLTMTFLLNVFKFWWHLLFHFMIAHFVLIFYNSFKTWFDCKTLHEFFLSSFVDFEESNGVLPRIIRYFKTITTNSGHSPMNVYYFLAFFKNSVWRLKYPKTFNDIKYVKQFAPYQILFNF